MRSVASIEANLYWRYIAQRDVELRSKADTILQTAYDYSNYRDYNDYDDLRAQVLWTIELAINKSSANELSTLSQEKTKVGVTGTNDDSGRSSTTSDVIKIKICH